MPRDSLLLTQQTRGKGMKFRDKTYQLRLSL